MGEGGHVNRNRAEAVIVCGTFTLRKVTARLQYGCLLCTIAFST